MGTIVHSTVKADGNKLYHTEWNAAHKEGLDTAYSVYVGATEPNEKYDGRFWIDTSGAEPVAKVYDEGGASWIEIGTGISGTFIGLRDNASTIVSPAGDKRIQFTDDGIVNADASGNTIALSIIEGQIDHGSIGGLGDDDHSDYLNNTRHDLTARHSLGTVVPHDAFTGLSDTPSTYTGSGSKYLRIKATEDGIEFVTGTGGDDEFTDHSDTPNSYTGQGGKFVRVNATPDALEFVTHDKALHDALALSHDSLSDVSSDDHHAQQHAMVSNDHTASGLTVGYVIRATSATAFAWQQLQHGDLGGVGSGDHHTQIHTLSGGDHTGDLAYVQLDSLVDTAGGGSASMISGAQHVHTAADGSSKIDHGAAIEGLLDDDHTIYLLASGARALTGAWAVGSQNITGIATLEADLLQIGATEVIDSNRVLRNIRFEGAGAMYTLFKEGSTYYAVSGDEDEVTYSGTNYVTVITNALAAV